MAGALTRGRKSGEALVKAVAVQIAKDSPRLADLKADDLRRLARVVVAESLKDDLRRESDLAGIDYQSERKRFLAQLHSRHTRLAYTAGIVAIEAEADRLGISVLALSPAQADDWVQSLQAAPGTVRLRVAAASAFYSWLERRHSVIRNPLRGSKARPKGRPVRTLAVPTDAEIKIMADAASPELRAAIILMATVGLRVGALPEIVIRSGRYRATTKGQAISGAVPGHLLPEITRAGLPLPSPWRFETPATIADRFRYLSTRLHRDGKIASRFSVHGLRHAAAVRIYTATRDIYATSAALHHASVTVTENYLRSLGLR